MRLLRFDFADFPQRVQLAACIGSLPWEGTLHYADEAYALCTIQSIWWRRPHPPQADSSYDLPTRTFVNQENLRGFLGVLQERDTGQGPFWVSRRDRIQAAEFKPAQLQQAQ